MTLAVLLVFAFVLSVAFSGLFSGLETGLYTTSRLRLYLDADAGVQAAIRVRSMLSSMPRLLAVLLVANNVANYGASFSAQLFLRHAELPAPEVWGTLVVTPILFLLGESAPKSAFIGAREALLYPATPLLVATHRLLAPVVTPIAWLAQRLARFATRHVARKTPVGDEIFRSGTAEGLLTPFQQRVAEGILTMRAHQATDEAVRPSEWPTARLGRTGVAIPDGHRGHRALVLDRTRGSVEGWMPLAELLVAAPDRPPRRRDLRPVVRVGRTARLDRVYAALDEAGAAFAVLPDGRVIDGHRLRERIMGTFREPGGRAVATGSGAP